MRNAALASPLPYQEERLIAFVEDLFAKAHEMGASDVHLEPLPAYVRLRCRCDGLLQEMHVLSKAWHVPLISRIKVMTHSMNIAEKRLPQEGRFQIVLDNQALDIRVATMPSLHGETMVLRLLNPEAFSQGVSSLGLTLEDQALVEGLLQSSEGLILVTGPTGSGKTTTLYTFLKALVAQDCKIITVEDPVEYRIPGVNHVNVQESIGMTFSAVLRSALRQATNKMMVGEIRDAVTAEIVIQASLTGHLIFSTLHTNDASSAIARLLSMGVAPFLLGGSLRAVIAQRLVRRLCPHCKKPARFTSEMSALLQLSPSLMVESTPMKACGCSKCQGTGFLGRLGIFEVFFLDDALREYLYYPVTTEVLRKEARKRGMKTLREDGIKKMLAGLTTPEEVLRHSVP